jgi:hypothetical protein
MQRLRAVANQLRAGDQVVRLRGVNLSGLEYSRGVVTNAVLDEIASWGANFLRLPFNQEWLLGDPGYLDELERAAHDAAVRGLYVLFDLHWLAYGRRRGSNPDGSNVATPPLPDGDSPRAWARMAERFAQHPAVMFDLLNEPHDRLAGDAFPLQAADGSLLGSQVGAAEWHPWVRRLAEEIRRHAPETALFVSGTDWGFQLAPLDLDNIVYASHIYPYPGKRTRADWERALAVAGPVVITELGPLDGDGDLAKMNELLDFLDEKGYGWAAWSWRDWPALHSGNDLTEWGRLVRERLRESGRA